MAADHLLPAPALALAERALGASLRALRPTSGGASHRTVGALFGAQPVVIKAAEGTQQRADLRHEAAILRALAGSGLAVPQLLAIGDDADWTVEVLAALPGENGLGLYAPERVAELTAAVRQLGQTLAQLHALPVQLDVGPPLAERFRANLAGPPLVTDPALDRGLRRASELAAAVDWRGAALVHTDAGLHNVLWDGRLSALLDWEWAGVGSPLFDLAWVHWTLHWRRVPRLWPELLAGYGLNADELALPELDRCALALIGLILARVHEKPEAQAEWQRRAAWTFDFSF